VLLDRFNKTKYYFVIMKKRISATIDLETDKMLDKLLKNNDKYRNMSHVIETAIKKLGEAELEK
jgi:Arc/MetJ-type ribon-helix-helix transcriptional regulator